MFFIEKVAILGAGLLGGSLAKALKARGAAGKVAAWSRGESTRAKCAKLKGVFDEVFDCPRKAAENADVVVLCAPTAAIPKLARDIAPSLKPGAILTDVGSVKSAICAECGDAVKNTKAHFVGSHPMAGSEKIGVDFSTPDLFEGRPCFVVGSAPQADIIAKMWEAVGMKVYAVSAGEHDAIVARVSHLPHLLAGTLCLVSAAYKTDLRPYAGPGFRDTTRVASGSPEMWDSILADNRREIAAALREFAGSLDSLIGQVESGDAAALASRLRGAKDFRDGLI